MNSTWVNAIPTSRTASGKWRFSQMRETQKLVRNATFRFIAPLHVKSATAAVAWKKSFKWLRRG